MHFRDAATRVLDEPTGKALLAEYSIATTRGVVVLTPSAAAPQVRQSELRFPLAAKLIGPDAIPYGQKIKNSCPCGVLDQPAKI